MSSNAIGMIETKGFVAALGDADSAAAVTQHLSYAPPASVDEARVLIEQAVADSGRVPYAQRQEVGDGLVAIIVSGEVGAVKAATEAGAETASQVGELVSVHVIPRPHGELGTHFAVNVG